ncbi:MAG: 16S rRNA (guanine(527)-N(7))-methyltransferase RsmG [Clostridiales bacterium]|jgi:16S rRNA (guanine527-N7)-methyltransferase|nr:16S rRNA (guanine(527)-N(7))-methyltransferase RsmG [Clostridiales bacterium]
MVLNRLERLSEKQKEQFERYYERLVEVNSYINLTAITERGEVMLKHFEDSLLAADFIRGGASVLDIGSGGGFPSVPLAIADPSLKITLVDSVNKKVKFLSELCAYIGVNADCVHARAEDLGALNYSVATIRNGAAKSITAAEYFARPPVFDYAVSRAVAPLATLAEYCLPYVKTGGTFIAYKAADCESELTAAASAISILGGAVSGVKTLPLADSGIIRALIIIKKTAATPSRYPRAGNKPRTAPL